MTTGRLTLQSGQPVQTADQMGKTQIFYAPYVGNTVPIYDSSVMQNRVFTSSDTDTVGLSLSLDSNTGHTGYHAADSMYDMFAYWTGSVVRLASGPLWTSVFANRGTGSGTTELQRFRGLWTNKNTITLRYGTSSGDTASVAANQATYLGTIYVKGDITMGMPLHPAAVAGGSKPVLCVWNMYNRVPARVTNIDSTTSWAYNSATVRLMNGSANNIIWWIDGMGGTQLQGTSTRSVGSDGTANAAYTNGVGFNEPSPNLAGGILNQAAFPTTTNTGCISIGRKTGRSLLGLNYMQEFEQSTPVSMGVFGNDFGAVELELEI